jgi:signal transduction histidine kinase
MDAEHYEFYMDDTETVKYMNVRKKLLKVITTYISKVTDLSIKNKELRRINETQQKVISILAHDVRNPLASLKNIIHLKKTALLDNQDAGMMMDMVNGQLNNTLEMVENIVNWGQAHLQGDLKFTDFNLRRLVENIFGSELLKSIEKNNDLINEVESGTIIHSNQTALEFVLRNLICNANKFTESGLITVSVRYHNAKTIISVSDTGVGMAEEKIAVLLTGNAYHTTFGTHKEKGSGLGLILVKEFINRLGGSLGITSAVNVGTCFEIIL